MTYLVLNADKHTIAGSFTSDHNARQWIAETQAHQERNGLAPVAYRIIPVAGRRP